MSLIQLLRLELPWITLCALLGKYTGEILKAEEPLDWAAFYSLGGVVITIVIWVVLNNINEKRLKKLEDEAPYEGRIKYIQDEDVPASVARANGYTQYTENEYSRSWEPITEDTSGILAKVRKY